VEKFDKLEIMSSALTGDDDLEYFVYENPDHSDYEDHKSSEIKELLEAK